MGHRPWVIDKKVFRCEEEKGFQMNRQPSCCDFCGFPQVSKEYPTGRESIKWYACRVCADLIDRADWDRLVERAVAAYFALRAIPENEETALRKQAQTLVERFRAVRLTALVGS